MCVPVDRHTQIFSEQRGPLPRARSQPHANERIAVRRVERAGALRFQRIDDPDRRHHPNAPRSHGVDFSLEGVRPADEDDRRDGARWVQLAPGLEFERGSSLDGPTPCIEGLWIATGCGGMGIAGSGSVGRWWSDWILKGNCTDDVSSFAPPRFKGHDPDSLREECRHVYSNYYALNSVTYSLG